MGKISSRFNEVLLHTSRSTIKNACMFMPRHNGKASHHQIAELQIHNARKKNNINQEKLVETRRYHTVGPAKREVPESAIAEHPPLQYPVTHNNVQKIDPSDAHIILYSA